MDGAVNCKDGKTGVCLNVNPDRPGSAYGYVDMGGWVGGQAEYVLVPYADWNLLVFPDKDQAMEKILDLAMLADIFPTGYHGCVGAGVTTGSTVYIAGAGPVGLAAATAAQLLGAADGDRRRHATRSGWPRPAASAARPSTCRRASRRTRSNRSWVTPEVDCGVDAVGFEARGHGENAGIEHPATVLNSLMDLTRAGGALGIPGLYVTGDPGARRRGRQGGLAVRSGWGSAGPSRTRS